MGKFSSVAVFSKITASVCVAVFGLGVGATYAQGAASDTDHDGVPDNRDRCLHTAQLKKLPTDFKYRRAVSADRYSVQPKAWPVDEFGCEPDSDKDGVIDSKDYCPEDSTEEISKRVAANGCPRHSDMDGTPDWRDRCPGTPRGLATDGYGCPVQRPAGQGAPTEAG